MPSRFAQQFSRAGAPSLVSQFGESITYYPQGVIANGRPIDAIIERNVEVVNESGLVSYAIIVRVLDHAVKGILSTAIDDGRDTISVSFIPDGIAEVRQITRMTSDANGMVRFMVR
jgi:hypothetical protein